MPAVPLASADMPTNQFRHDVFVCPLLLSPQWRKIAAALGPSLHCRHGVLLLSFDLYLNQAAFSSLEGICPKRWFSLERPTLDQFFKKQTAARRRKGQNSGTCSCDMSGKCRVCRCNYSTVCPHPAVMVGVMLPHSRRKSKTKIPRIVATYPDFSMGQFEHVPNFFLVYDAQQNLWYHMTFPVAARKRSFAVFRPA